MRKICRNGHNTEISGRRKYGSCIACEKERYKRNYKPKNRKKNPICNKGHNKDILGRMSDGHCRQCQKDKLVGPKPPKRICNYGHDMYVTGKMKNGGCKICKKERNKIYNEKNKEKIAKIKKEYSIKNPEVGRMAKLKNKIDRRQRIVEWGQKEIIKFIKNCPKGMQIDHIIPLKGDLVSGLHVSWNLQYLDPMINLFKRNYIDLNWASEWYGKLLEEIGLK